MRSFAISLFFLCAFGILAANAQDKRNWQSLAQLRPGDHVRVLVKTGNIDGEFQAWTARDLTVKSVTTKQEDVLAVVRYLNGTGGGRGKRAAIGALIGFGGGFGIGEAAGNCKGFCVVSRTEVGVVSAAVGAVVGAGIGALIPSHRRQETIYSAH